MPNKARVALEKRAQQAILQHAVFRWESAVVIALTLLLTVFAPQIPFLQLIPAWAWLIGGLAAEAALVYSSLSDVEANRQVVANMLKTEFQPQRLRTPELQRVIQEALDYRGRITAAIRERRDTVLKDDLVATAGQFDEWIEEMYDLARRLDRFYGEKELHQNNRQRAENRRKQLQNQLARENNPAVRREIETNLASIERQLETIEQLENAMERAALRLENTATAMSTIYTQVTLLGAKDIDSGRAQRLRQEIAEEVTELSDVLQAMDEVYASDTAM